MSKCVECLYPVPEGTGHYPDWTKGAQRGRLSETDVAEALGDGLLTLETLVAGVEPPERHFLAKERVEANPEEEERLYVYTACESWGEDRYYQERYENHGPVCGAAALTYTNPPERDDEHAMNWSEWSRLTDPGRVIDLMPTAVLLYACETGDLEACDAALEAGAEVDPLYRKPKAIKHAVDHDQPAILRRILEKHKIYGPTMWNAVLGAAIVNGYDETLDVLLAHKDPNLHNEVLTDLIRFSSDVAMAERLVEAGAQANEIKNLHNSAIQTVVGYHTHEPDPPRAANAAELIQWFADHGCDPCEEHFYQGTALHMAVERWNVPAIRKLIELGVPLDLERDKTPYRAGQTPQMIADAVGKGEELAALMGREWRAHEEPLPDKEFEPFSALKQPGKALPVLVPQETIGGETSSTPSDPEPQPRTPREAQSEYEALDPQEKARRGRLLRYIVGGLIIMAGLQIGITQSPTIGFVLSMVGAVVIGVALSKRPD